MAEPHVISALKDKRAEVSGIIADLEKRINQHRTDLQHVDAVLRLFAPEVEPDEIRPKAVRQRNEWFRPGECSRTIFDVLRTAEGPILTRAITEAVMIRRGLDPADARTRDLLHKTVLGALNRLAPEVVGVALPDNGGRAWRLADAA